jgi:1-acyl-sn-glycerol-3-phosphate acyltransferase
MAALAGLGLRPGGERALGLALGGRVRRFAGDVARFDRAVGHVGVAFAARDLAARYGCAISATGAERVPDAGPLLLVANHPGLADALAVYATAGRPDLRALARPQPILALLPEMGRHLLPVPDDRAGRLAAVRSLLRHLEGGGAALLFPAGRLEPDPARLATDAEPLGAWSTSFGALVRLAVDRGIPLRVVPTAVSGVFAEQTWRRFGPLIRLRRSPRARADLAALLQLAFPALGSTTARVRYGEPLEATALVAETPDAAALTAQVRAAVASLLTRTD